MSDWRNYPLQLGVRPWRLVVAKLPPNRTYTRMGEFWCLLQSPTETSLICEDKYVPREATGMAANWRCLEVAGPLNFSMVGILARISQPLAEADISIFVVSAFETDYVLVRQEDMARATEALRASGCIVVGEPAAE